MWLRIDKVTPHQFWNVCDWETTERDQPSEAPLSLPTCPQRKSGKTSFRLWPSHLRKEVNLLFFNLLIHKEIRAPFRPAASIILAISWTPNRSHISHAISEGQFHQSRRGPRRPAPPYANAGIGLPSPVLRQFSRQFAVALVHAGLTSPPRQLLREIETHPQSVRQCVVARSGGTNVTASTVFSGC